jgi:cadmium resistance protein CadD (predicted permease)
MPAKKKVEVPKTCCQVGKAHKWIMGIIAILLGLAVWNQNITLETFFGIVFVIIGLKVLFFKHSHPC